MPSEEINQVIVALTDLIEDSSVPKNVKMKLQEILASLKPENISKDERSMAVNKALHHLDEAANDANIETYTRTQLWNVASMLEKLHSE